MHGSAEHVLLRLHDTKNHQSYNSGNKMAENMDMKLLTIGKIRRSGTDMYTYDTTRIHTHVTGRSIPVHSWSRAQSTSHSRMPSRIGRPLYECQCDCVPDIRALKYGPMHDKEAKAECNRVF